MPATNSKKIWEDIRSPLVIPEIIFQIEKKLPTGTVQSITAGSGLTATPANTFTTTGTISLDAGVCDLKDTNFSLETLAPDQILTWNGTSWINKAVVGILGTSFSFVDLIDVDVKLATEHGNILRIDPNGLSVTSVPNNFLTSNTGVRGIKTSQVGSNITTEFYPQSIQTDNMISGDYFVYYKNTVNPRRQLIDTLNISLFNNNLNLITGGDLIEGTAITITPGANNTRTIGVSTTQLTVNFSAGVSGILGITNGGTSGSTSASARTNLGLAYNVDILTKTGPSFTGNMFGNNVTLLPSSFGVSLVTGGTGYTSGQTLTLLNQETGHQFNAPVTITTSGGVITGPTYFSLSISNIGLSDSNTILNVANVGGGASYQIIPDPAYLLFGGSTADTGIGLRDRQGIIELKSTHTGDGSSWQQVFPLAVGGLCNVTTSSLANNDFLIYNSAGSSFVNTSLTGNTDYSISLNQIGTSTQIAITPFDKTIGISKLDSNVTKTEFDYLAGANSNIQTQLNNRIGTSPNGTEPSTGDMVWYSGTCWSILRAPTLSGNYILGVSDANLTPFYSYLHSYTTPSVSEAWLTDQFVYVKSNTTPAYRTALPDYLEHKLCNPSGGLKINTVPKTLELEITNLPTGTSFNNPSSDSIIYYNTTAGFANRMTIVNLAGELAGENLTGTTVGKISIASELTRPLKLKRFTTGLSLHNDFPPASYTGAITGLSVPGTNGTSLVFCNGTCWYIVPLGDPISLT